MGSSSKYVLMFLVVSLLLECIFGKGAPPDVMAKTLGYTVDIHTVKTADGYSIQIFRYLGRGLGKSDPNPKGQKPTVFLIPGLGCNAGTWLVEDPQSLPNLLADEGYEVWLGNLRGSLFGKNHDTYSVHSDEFWNFGWNENALYDLGATMRYIKKISGQDKIQYVGHSLGSTLFFVLSSLTTEFNSFFSHAYLLAPVVYLGYITDVTIFARHFTPLIRDVLSSFFHDQFPLQELRIPELCSFICRETNWKCQMLTMFTSGKGNPSLEKLKLMFKYYPDDLSTKQLLQFEQHIRKARRFRQLSYGFYKNKKTYGTFDPPPYNISTIVTPLSLYYGSTDAIATLKDGEELRKDLINLKRFYVTPFKPFSHSDFFIGKNASDFYLTLVKHMKEDIGRS